VTELIDPAAERYALAHTTPFAGALAAAAQWTAANTQSPQMMAGVAEARLLQALAVAGGARRVLEIGTFTGIGAVSLAQALPADGQLTTLELDPETAEIAKRHIEAAGLSDRVRVIVGDARVTLEQLDGPFDLVWIDAWKADYPHYWQALRGKLAPRGIIAADNLFRDGAVLHDQQPDEGTVGMRRFADELQADPDFDNVLLSIGDGVMLAWRRPGA
jgi:predicted O-methyltransferase YrrM